MLNNFVTGVSTMIAASALRNISNKLPGNDLSYNTGNGSGGANTHDFKSLEPVANSKNYTFPLDVESGPGLGNQGHYMLFYINAQQKAKLGYGKGSGFSIDLQGSYDIPDVIKRLGIQGDYTKVLNGFGIQNQLNLDHFVSQAFGQMQSALGSIGVNFSMSPGQRNAMFGGKEFTTVAVERAPTKRLDTAIAMYMPASVTTSYGAQYTDTEMGAVTEEAIAMYEQFAQGNIRGGFDEIGRSSTDIADAISNLMLTTAGSLPGLAGVKEASEMKSGVILADRLELAFKGIDKRKFEYEFKMIPKSQREAEEIRNIIFAFKSAMMPEFEGGNTTGRRLIVPHTFDIEYMWNGQENQFINKISECVLTNMNVTYGGDRYKTHEGIEGDGAPPIETTISLSFSELELITREMIHRGF